MTPSKNLIELGELAAVCARELKDPMAQACAMVKETLEQGPTTSALQTSSLARSKRWHVTAIFFFYTPRAGNRRIFCGLQGRRAGLGLALLHFWHGVVGA
jgi:hypothetical protein